MVTGMEIMCGLSNTNFILFRLNYLLLLLGSRNACIVPGSIFSSCLMACLIHHHSIPHRVTYDKGNDFIAKEAQHTYGIN